ncbi:MAG: nitrophenyl compound nitroreductase subunit ArsF family protein [Ignavibacteria bacterium]
MKFKYNYILFTISILFLIYIGCNKSSDKTGSIDSTQNKADSIIDMTNEQSKSVNTFTDTLLIKKDKDKEDSLRSILTKRRNDSLKANKENEVKLIAYYFHPTARCVTCRNIEAYSIEAINEWEENSGRKVVWKELNIEDSVNEHYVDEYNLQFSSLVIARYTEGRKDKWKNLEETWKLVNDKDSFKKYVIFELNQFIKNN